MKFNFNMLVLWLKNGKVRTIFFEPNKINIITGDSNTGKTAILDIIDYCLFASKHKISDSMINENIEWYGIQFSINEKCYTVARKAPSGNTVSRDYYFSSTGEIPENFPIINISDNDIKTALESDFGIDCDTKVSYGGKAVKANSKISIRYFLLFNTISQDIITHSEEFFDKQKDDRYREALPRIFDLAVGIDTTENIFNREKREEIDREIKKLKREQNRLISKQDAFYAQLASTVKTAKEFELIPNGLDIDDDVLNLKETIEKAEVQKGTGVFEKYDTISAEINLLKRKMNNLERFTKEYKIYKSNLKNVADSLKPIEFLANTYEDSIKTSIYSDIINSLQEDCAKIKRAIANKTPLDSNVADSIKIYEKRLNELEEKRALLPEYIKVFENEKMKYIFLGETKAKLDLYDREKTLTDDSENATINKLIADSSNLVVESVESRKEFFIKVLDETVQEYIGQTKLALENYGEYRSSFNYKEKKLQLRKPKTNFIENVGSSSNHMFLHLFLFLGLHELIIQQNGSHVPPFLIIDQFSRPYWGEGDNKKEELNHTDISKVHAALTLLNSFMESMNKTGNEFQMIIFEHINCELWKDMPYVHLVEEFRNDNALIPHCMLEPSAE